MKPILSLIIQTIATLLGGIVLIATAPTNYILAPYLWMTAGFGISYMGVALAIRKIFEKTHDIFYLVFLGISGMRFLFFMGTLVVLLAFRPDIKNIPIILALTVWFIAAMFVEMLIFLTNLRHNSKKQS